MKMKRLAVAAGLCASACAMAQTATDLTLYGLIDVSARRQTGFTSTYGRSPASTTTVASGVGPTSRWGIRGTEDLGGGLRAFFNLEAGINADTGAPSIAGFDRASVVGLGGSWGTVAAGRQNTLVADSAGLVDPIGLRFAGLNPNIQVTSLTGHQLGIEFGPTNSTGSSNRVNNSLKYSVPVGPVVARAMYGFGEVAGDTTKQSSVGLGLDYISSGFSATSAYIEFRDVNGRELQAANLGATWLALPSLRVMANVGHNRGETSPTAVTTNRLRSVGINYAFTPTVDVLAGYYKVDRSRTAQANDGFNRLLAFVEYKFSRRSRVFLELDTTHWKGNYLGAGNKSVSNGVSLGITHSF